MRPDRSWRATSAMVSRLIASAGSQMCSNHGVTPCETGTYPADGNQPSVTANTATSAMPTTNDGHHGDDRGEAGDRAVHPGGLPQGGERAEREPERHADHEGDPGDRETDERAAEQRRRDGGAVHPAQTEVAVQHPVQPVPVLQEERLVEAPLVLELCHLLRGRRLAELQVRGAEPAELAERERDERAEEEHGDEDGQRPAQTARDAVRPCPACACRSCCSSPAPLLSGWWPGRALARAPAAGYLSETVTSVQWTWPGMAGMSETRGLFTKRLGWL